jgi:chromosome segregation ATPase
MKYLGLDLHCLHALKKHKQHWEKTHSRLIHVEGRLEKKEEHASLFLQEMEKLHKKLKDSIAQLNTKKEDIEDFTYKVENWDRRMESYISYMNESNAENYGKLIDQQDQLWKFERMLKEHQEKASLPHPHFSNLEERIDDIIEILDGDIKREEARDLRMESLEKQSLRCQEKMSGLSDHLESMGKELGFLYEKLHEKDTIIDQLRLNLESLLSSGKETVIMPENKENIKLMANMANKEDKKLPAKHGRVKSQYAQYFSDQISQFKEKPTVTIDLFTSNKPPTNKKK